jgi:hypothetical protein
MDSWYYYLCCNSEQAVSGAKTYELRTTIAEPLNWRLYLCQIANLLLSQLQQQHLLHTLQAVLHTLTLTQAEQ